MKCTVILDDNGKGSMDVLSHPGGVKFFEESNIAGKFYAHVNGGGNSYHGVYFIATYIAQQQFPF